MDGSRFDDLARLCAATPSRRGLLRAAGSALAAAVFTRVGDRSASADTTCKPAAPLPQAKCTKDAQCCAGLVCQATTADPTTRCRPGCHINGAFYASGATNPANRCQSCQPNVSTTGWTAKANNTACNDGNACTRTDTCQGGVCTGGNPVVCTAFDQCHVAGTCDQNTGLCSNPVNVGASCNSGDPCTVQASCQADGSCSGTVAPDGTSCGAGRLTCCSGTCVDLDTDNYNCGACGNDYCPRNFADTVCRNGVCCFTRNNACDPTPEPPYPACCSGVCTHFPDQPDGANFCQGD